MQSEQPFSAFMRQRIEEIALVHGIPIDQLSKPSTLPPAMAPPLLPYRVVSLSPKQREMLLHCLEGAGGCCIAEALGISEDELPLYEIAERKVVAQVRAGKIILRHLSELGLRILVDAINSSTWCALHDDGGISACPALRGARRTVQATHRNLTRAGLKLNDPVLCARQRIVARHKKNR